MKIGVNTLFYLPGEVGGSETYLLEILRVWKREALPREVVLFTQKENHEKLSAEFEGEGWACVLSPFQARNRVVRILREQFELPFRVRRVRPDVLWSPGYTAPVFAGCPQTVSLLDMQYKHFPKDLTRIARLTTDVLVRACALDKRKQILTISEYAGEDIVRFTFADRGRIHVTPLAADSAFCPAKSAEAPSPPRILCVANSYPHKCVDRLIAAFALLEEAIPHELVVIGKPRLGEPAVRSALARLKNPDRVRRLSGLSREELIDQYRAADLFVFPSAYEGFGLPVLEAMQAGVPVLTTRCASIPEVGGDAAAYVEDVSPEALRDGILRLLNEGAAARKARIERGLTRSRLFSWERTARDTLAVLVAQSRRKD